MTKWRFQFRTRVKNLQRNSIYKYIYIYYFFDPNTRFQKRHFVISSLRHFQDYRIVMNTIKNIITCSLHVLYKHRKVKNRPRAPYSPFTFINNARHSFAFPPPRRSTTTCDKNGLFDYATLSFDGAIAHLAHFCANLWQIFTLIWHIHHIPLTLSRSTNTSVEDALESWGKANVHIPHLQQASGKDLKNCLFPLIPKHPSSSSLTTPYFLLQLPTVWY